MRLREHLEVLDVGPDARVGADRVAGDDDHRDAGSELLRDREAVHPGQPDVEHGELRMLAVEELGAPPPPSRGDHPVALLHEDGDEKVADARVVLDHEHRANGHALTVTRSDLVF